MRGFDLLFLENEKIGFVVPKRISLFSPSVKSDRKINTGL